MSRWFGAALLVAFASCRSSEPAPAPVAADTTPLGPSSARADTAPEAPPRIGSLSKMVLERRQGGPAVMHCDGIAYELTIDLVSSGWTYKLCDPGDAGVPAPHEPLTVRRGSFTLAQRGRIEADYLRLKTSLAESCGNDGGALTLTLERSDREVARYVDENWGCKKPPPIVAKGLPELATNLVGMVLAP